MPIRGKPLQPSNSAVMQVLIDELKSSVLIGRIYHPSTQKVVDFSGVCDLLSKLEGMYNALSFPQATHDLRSFFKKKIRIVVGARQETKDNTDDREVSVKVTDKNDEIKIEPSGKGTFIIRVLYRQNATWQGNIQWVEGKKTQNFRSDLEMLKLIDDAVRNDEEEDDVAKWD